VGALVGDVTNVADWNTFFDLPTLGTPFTSVSVTGNEVKLYGGSGIKAKPALMYGGYGNDGFILELDDQAGCITSVGGDAFSYQYLLTTVNLPECTIVYGYSDSPESDVGGFGYCNGLTNLSIPKLVTAGENSFQQCSSLTSINFPLLITAENSSFNSCTSVTSVTLPILETVGMYAFAGATTLTTISLPNTITFSNGVFGYCTSLTTISLPSCINLGPTVGDNGTFTDITGNTITLTIPTALMTCNSGNPDGDIAYLQANNTVTIITV
jgi:hypothetical protein